MLKRIDKRNQALWRGHSSLLEDATHVLGGVGIGLLLQPAVRGARKSGGGRTKSVGWSLIAMSTAMHVYADMVKPSKRGLRAKLF